VCRFGREAVDLHVPGPALLGSRREAHCREGRRPGEYEHVGEAEEFVDAGDAVVVAARQIARGRGSGAEVTNRLVGVYGFREGKVIYFDAFRRKREALEAAGLSD